LAHPVDRAGVDTVVLVLVVQLPEQVFVSRRSGIRYLSTKYDSLPGGHGEILTRAHGFAIPALDAAIDLPLDGRSGLEVRDV
jgi:hypothetical protein